jgi:hypothetical protein
MTKEEILAYFRGVQEGLWRHAHWKDGVQYVGNMGVTYVDACLKVDAECERELEKYGFKDE